MCIRDRLHTESRHDLPIRPTCVYGEARRQRLRASQERCSDARRLRGVVMGSRFRIVGWMALAYFAIAMLTRLVLGLSLPPDAAVGVADLPVIVGIGVLYDACFIAYASILPLLFIAACPEALWQRMPTRVFV